VYQFGEFPKSLHNPRIRLSYLCLRCHPRYVLVTLFLSLSLTKKKFFEFLVTGNEEKAKKLLEKGLDPNFQSEATGGMYHSRFQIETNVPVEMYTQAVHWVGVYLYGVSLRNCSWEIL